MNHMWRLENRIPACDSPDGNKRTEKTCPVCGLVKITVHWSSGRIPDREWRLKDGRQLIGGNTPHGCRAEGATVVPPPVEVQAI